MTSKIPISSVHTNDVSKESNIGTPDASFTLLEDRQQQPLLPLEMVPTTSNSSSNSSSSSNSVQNYSQERRVVLKHGSWSLAVGGDKHTCWSFGRTNDNETDRIVVSSTCFLEVTCRAVKEAMPTYTRSTYARFRRLWKSTGFCSSSSEYPTHTYTLADVHSIHKAPHQALSSLHQNTISNYEDWKGIQIFLRPHGSSANATTTTSSNNNTTKEEVQPFLHSSAIIITFAIPTSSSNDDGYHSDANESLPLLWKVDFPLDSTVAMDNLTILRGPLQYNPVERPIIKKKHPTHVYLNGWQSWSFAGSVSRGQPQPTSAMPDYLSKSFNYGACHPPFHPHHYYKSDMYLALTTNDRFHTIHEDDMLDENNSSCIILGFLSQKKQFGLITADHSLTHVAMHCSFDGSITIASPPINFISTATTAISTTKSTDWAWCQILNGSHNQQQKDPLAQYLDSVSTYNHARHTLREPSCIGWCSWYHYYENIAEQVLIDNLDHLKSNSSSKFIPFNMAMCDGEYTCKQYA
jgi:hypothetical protein